MRKASDIRKKIKALRKKPRHAQYKGFSEGMRNTEADILEWVLGKTEKLPFEAES